MSVVQVVQAVEIVKVVKTVEIARLVFNFADHGQLLLICRLSSVLCLLTSDLRPPISKNYSPSPCNSPP